MSTGYGREGLRQVCATLLGARHVPERLCGGLMPTWGAITNVHLYLLFLQTAIHNVNWRILIYAMNNPARLHPDPIGNDGAAFLKRSPQAEEEEV